MLNGISHDGATIIPFPVAKAFANRLTRQERQYTLEWEKEAWAFGYAQVTICENHAQDALESGDFVLIYWKGEIWTLRAIARPSRRFGLWRKGGIKTAEFPTLEQALNAILTTPLIGQGQPHRWSLGKQSADQAMASD